RFKVPRPLEVDIRGPGGGRRTVWYLWYQVSNPTFSDHTFIPDFEWVLPGRTSSYHDEVLPAVEQAVVRSYAVGHAAGIRNSITIATQPVPATHPGGTRKWVTGVAVWNRVPGDRSPFSIFVSGLSSAWVVAEPPDGARDVPTRIKRKSLRLDFKRTAGEVQ